MHALAAQEDLFLCLFLLFYLLWGTSIRGFWLKPGKNPPDHALKRHGLRRVSSVSHPVKKTPKKSENATKQRFPIFKQQAKERSPPLFPRIMTLVLSHSMSPRTPPRGFPLHIRVLPEWLFSG